MNQERLIKILADLAENGLSQMVITDPSAIFYLTGIRISPGERLLALYLRANGNFRLIVNRLFDVPEGIGAAVEWYGDNEDGAALLARFTERHRPLGVDKNMAARFLLRLMELGAASSFVCASGSVDLVRARKDAGEIERMRRASQLNDRAMELVRRHIRAGLTEEELADFILLTFRRLGAEGVSFDPLVGFGPNAAGGHHAPGTAVLREGDCVLVDMGCKLDGYCSDMTRTFFYRSVSDKMRKVYETVRAANEAARAASSRACLSAWGPDGARAHCSGRLR
jgi:Xaa-Pro dipeptidase